MPRGEQGLLRKGAEMIKTAWKYFKTICKHKAVVYQECRACGITWQGIIHDLSKFSRDEFISSAKYKAPFCIFLMFILFSFIDLFNTYGLSVLSQ